MFTPDNVEQIHHMARLSFLAMAARGVALSEHEAAPEVRTLDITVTVDPDHPVPSVDLEFRGVSQMPIGGVSL